MAGVIITGDVFGSGLYCYGTPYAKARTGDSPARVGGGEIKVGQRLSGSTYYVYQMLLSFPLVSLGDHVLSGVGINITAGEDHAQTAFTLEAFLHDWGASVDMGDFAGGDRLAMLTRCAVLASARFPALAAGAGGAYNQNNPPYGDSFGLPGSAGLVVLRWTGGSATFDVAGAYSWTCPPGVAEVNVQAIGGGGGGGGATDAPGHRGGGGAFAEADISVTPGQSYQVVVGAAGVSAGTVGTNGGTSTFASTSVVADRGHGASSTASGAPGLAANCTGTTKIGGTGATPGAKTTGVRGLPLNCDAALFTLLQYPDVRPDTLRLVLTSSRQRLGNAPGAPSEYLDRVSSSSFQLVANFSGNLRITGTATRRLSSGGTQDAMAFDATRSLKASGRIRAAMPQPRAGTVKVYDFNRQFMGTLPGTVRISRKLDGLDELNLTIPWQYPKHTAETLPEGEE